MVSRVSKIVLTEQNRSVIYAFIFKKINNMYIILTTAKFRCQKSGKDANMCYENFIFLLGRKDKI